MGSSLQLGSCEGRRAVSASTQVSQGLLEPRGGVQVKANVKPAETPDDHSQKEIVRRRLTIPILLVSELFLIQKSSDQSNLSPHAALPRTRRPSLHMRT